MHSARIREGEDRGVTIHTDGGGHTIRASAAMAPATSCSVL